MGVFSSKRIQRGLQSAGFSDDLIPVMTAITFAESGGNPRAHNHNVSTGDNSYGLLQINMINDIGRERREHFSLTSNRDLFDPSVNFKVAKQIYDQQGLDAWGSYRNGSYKPFFDESTTCLLPTNESRNSLNNSERYSFGVRDLLLKKTADRNLIFRFDQENVSSIFFNDEHEGDLLIKPISLKKLSKQLRLALTNQQPVNASIQFWKLEFSMHLFDVVDFSRRKGRLSLQAELLDSDQLDSLLISQELHDIGFMIDIG
ncbi:transglycosylase SLT domain-containing protein [Synechococcus sp. MIT S1220]|uniref:transglycosylase SLT domain-containing protein n=1 Tax=Synechococcus sp. MIT S1220 TaxID=3082549 RepID=UPI0039AECDA7